jgi:hypothetical protein
MEANWMTDYATRHVTFLGNVETSIESGEPIIVHGIAVTATTGSVDTIVFTDASSSPSTLLEMRTSTTVEVETKWLADAGLRSDGTGGANTRITVFYRPSG